MAQGWLKEIFEENRKTVNDWPDWKKGQQLENGKKENNDNSRMEKSVKDKK